MSELKLELHSPITEEEWDLITDVDLDHTPSVKFHTKRGKDIEYIKVKHGRWIRKESKRSYWFECSECGYPPPLDKFKREWFSNYCPNCGAKMDERESEE